MYNNDIIIYTTEDGLSEFTLRELDGELWLTQKEIAELYQTSKQNISKHIKAIFAEQELDDSVVNFQFTTIDVYDDNTDEKFIYYLLTQKHITDYLHTIGENSVSSYPSINPDDIANLKFTVPDLKTQQSIAAVLSALDKKIALNKQINVRLEEMAKTLYDYWFVQFDFPDANGKPLLQTVRTTAWGFIPSP